MLDAAKPQEHFIETRADPGHPIARLAAQIAPTRPHPKGAVLARGQPDRRHALRDGQTDIGIGIARQHPVAAPTPCDVIVEIGQQAAGLAPNIGNEPVLGARPFARVAGGEQAKANVGADRIIDGMGHSTPHAAISCV